MRKRSGNSCGALALSVGFLYQSQCAPSCRVASRSSASEAAALKRRHYQWLLETGQDEEAGRVKERDGDFVGAISLFLKGGLPGKAAQVNATMHTYYAPHWFDELEWCRLPLLQHFNLLWVGSCVCLLTLAAGWLLCKT